MYEIASKIMAVLVILCFMLIFVCIGQWIGLSWPETIAPILGVAFCLALVLGLGCFLAIYDMGKEAARKEQEPDEIISRTGEEGVFLQPTGSHETDPFVK